MSAFHPKRTLTRWRDQELRGLPLPAPCAPLSAAPGSALDHRSIAARTSPCDRPSPSRNQGNVSDLAAWEAWAFSAASAVRTIREHGTLVPLPPIA